MKKSKVIIDALIILILLVLTAAALAPSQIVMPGDVKMILIIVLFGLVSSFVVLVWRERPEDEREAENQQQASRLAYVAGCGTLILAMLVQSFQHKLDAAIPIVLLVMIMTKIIWQRLKDDM